ncbi:hypothetical protein VTN77DRAFT_6937 [Rasamsonia byssochlamydoides]|uniref:uncharacterized protein n=1 Tax=Rasamsonia byssochlamydoides TaxID=89139 RepID=UPI003744A92B
MLRYPKPKPKPQGSMSSVDESNHRVVNETGPLLNPNNNNNSDSDRTGSHVGMSPGPDPDWHIYHVILRLNNINVLLVFLPLGILSGLFGWNSILTSVFNFLAIIALSALVSYSADELSHYLGELAGELINATFGNAIELIAGIVAVSRGEIHFAQSVMIGSILSDILLVLGCSLISAAYRKHVLKFKMAVADALSSLMIITAVALILPTVLYSTFSSSNSASDISDKIVSFSHGTAVVLLILYAGYLYFNMGTHSHLFTEDKGDDRSVASDDETDNNDSSPGQQQETPNVSFFTAGMLLLGAAVGIMSCAHFLLQNIDQTSRITGMSKTFIASILIPIASNSPEGAAVVAASRGGDINFAIGVIVSSILQIGLFVMPFLVVLGWVIQQPMTLNFDSFQTTILFFAVLVVNHVLQAGKYTYIHGVMLVSLYAVIATALYTR